jgi:fructose-1,6-bisphosphatase/inositol monophosphatase family enzyme
MVRAGAAAALAAGRSGLREKSADPADVVTAADHAAEAAVLALVPPGDAVLAEESGAHGQARRTWVVDPVDGTANFAAQRPLWCVAAALLVDGLAEVAAVYDAERDELHAARRGEPAGAVSAAADPRAATVAAYVRADKGDPALLGRLAGAVGSLRVHGSGSLELAWVAAGRLDAWLQPHPSPWDWLPGALLVEAAGGATAVTPDGWHVAGAPALVDALVREAPWRR